MPRPKVAWRESLPRLSLNPPAPGHAHPLSEASGAGQKRRIVAELKPFQATDRKSGIKRESLFRGSSRFIQLPEMRERGGSSKCATG